MSRRQIAGAAAIASIALLVGALWHALATPLANPPDMPPVQYESLVSRSVERPPILLISVDTLRADHLGLYGYARSTTPHIDAWFERSRIYTAAYSTEASTAPSVLSFLTGRLPQEHGVRLHYQQVQPEVTIISDFLRAAGYQTAAVVSNLVLTAEASGLDTRFDYYDDFVDERFGVRPVPLLLYDLSNDPHALSSLHEERPDLVKHYTAFLEARWKAHQALAQQFTPGKEAPLTPEQLRTLRSLGYIE